VGVQDTVKAIFDKVGIPESVWKPIETVESGGDQFTLNTGTPGHPEHSVGLFQLNANGGLGNGKSDMYLFDPANNATIAANAMKPAYDRGVAQGLTGYQLTQYVAYNSGWPGSTGVNSILRTNPAYEPLLQKAYGNPDVNGYDTTSETNGNIVGGVVTSMSDLAGKLWSMNSLYIIGGSLAILLILVNVAKGGGK